MTISEGSMHLAAVITGKALQSPGDPRPDNPDNWAHPINHDEIKAFIKAIGEKLDELRGQLQPQNAGQVRSTLDQTAEVVGGAVLHGLTGGNPAGGNYRRWTHGVFRDHVVGLIDAVAKEIHTLKQ